MTTLRKLAVIAAAGAALLASRAQAEDDGWNTKYGMLFSVQNIFQNPTTVGDYSTSPEGGGIGFQYNLSPSRALRFSVAVSRASDPPYETQSGGATTTTTKVVPLETSHVYTKVGASYVMRFIPSSISPYLGAGASIRLDQGIRNGDAGQVGGTMTSYDWTNRTWGLGLDGTLGLEWRVHKSVAIFAEYLLDVTGYSSTSMHNVTKVAGLTTLDTKSTQTKWLNFSTAVGQGGQLGLVAFF